MKISELLESSDFDYRIKGEFSRVFGDLYVHSRKIGKWRFFSIIKIFDPPNLDIFRDMSDGSPEIEKRINQVNVKPKNPDFEQFIHSIETIVERLKSFDLIRVEIERKRAMPHPEEAEEMVWDPEADDMRFLTRSLAEIKTISADEWDTADKSILTLDYQFVQFEIEFAFKLDDYYS